MRISTIDDRFAAQRSRSRTRLREVLPAIAEASELSRVPELVGRWGTEFVACEDLSSTMVAAVCRAGYLPMALDLPGLPVLLVKSHHLRAVLRFSALHVTRNAGRYARGLRMFVDRHPRRTLETIVESYEDRWLTPALVETLMEIAKRPTEGMTVHSVEIYNGDRFVAGELGYVVGRVYTSLSGFHRQNGAGTVQLIALAEVLRTGGAAFWDLGMPAEYKLNLGAELLPRTEFLATYRRQLETGGDGRIVFPREPVACDAVVDAARGREVSARRDGTRTPAAADEERT
ncbi:MAG: GNAT family N-acetyltransferase [Alkalispirochaeta sp.]